MMGAKRKQDAIRTRENLKLSVVAIVADAFRAVPITAVAGAERAHCDATSTIVNFKHERAGPEQCGNT
jgi:hypothetical protein